MKFSSIKTETQYAKASYYHSDGTGRDGYITLDNGGLTQQLQRCEQPPVGAFRPKRLPHVYRPQTSQKTLHYVSDGTGRDNYVLDNHGGLMNTMNDRHWLNAFKSSLRTPESGGNCLSRPRSAITTTKRQQEQFCRKLSKPKKIRQPFHLQVATLKFDI